MQNQRRLDPDFEAKLLDVVGLYLNPPENALVLCVDEKTGIQALDRTQSLLPLSAKKPRSWTNEYVRHGTQTLLAALEIASGQVVAQVKQRRTSVNFLRFRVTLGNARERRVNDLRIQHHQMAPDVAPKTNRVGDWQSITRFERVSSKCRAPE
jgi:hypothetical protein